MYDVRYQATSLEFVYSIIHFADEVRLELGLVDRVVDISLKLFVQQ